MSVVGAAAAARGAGAGGRALLVSFQQLRHSPHQSHFMPRLQTKLKLTGFLFLLGQQLRCHRGRPAGSQRGVSSLLLLLLTSLSPAPP